MDRTTVFFFGRNPAMMAIVDLQLKAAGIHAQGFLDEQELLHALEAHQARMLVIGGGVEEEARQRLKHRCEALGVLVLEHHGGPQNLPGNIAHALG